MTNTRIHLILMRPDGRASNTSINGKRVTATMIDAAEDLLHAMTTGERLLPKDLYDVCARAFGTTRLEAKEKILAAMYGKHAKAAQ